MTSLEQHLAAHEYTFGACGCGQAFEYDSRTLLSAIRDAHRAHVAATWREARTVRTVEELDALDGGVVVMLLHSTGEPHGARMTADHTMCRKWIETGLALLIIWDPEGGAL